MNAAMLRDWQTVNQAGLSPHEMQCHQYLAMDAATYRWSSLAGADRPLERGVGLDAAAHALTNETTRGTGSPLSAARSGWNSVATKKGWPSSSTARTSPISSSATTWSG